jgi:threonine dehydrogenase-like Zn-dependent dehydrogenase
LLGIHEHGAFAEYLLAPAGKIIPVPGHLPDRYAVLAEPFAVGVHVCARAAMEPATRALVIGAGPIGLIVAMVARACGVKVAVSEISPDRQSTVTESGFDLIDAGNQPEQQAAELTNGDGFDTVFEVSGSKPGLGLAIEAARVRGTIVQVGFYSSPPEADLFKFTFKELHLVGSRVYRHEDFRRAVQLLDTLSKQEPALLDQLISETVDLGGVESAIRRMIAGEVAGKIVVNPGEGS